MEINNYNYREFLEFMKLEISEFLNLAEHGKSLRHAALKARKKSIRIRDILKAFRQSSLENDKRISKIMQDAKKKIESD